MFKKKLLILGLLTFTGCSYSRPAVGTCFPYDYIGAVKVVEVGEHSAKVVAPKGSFIHPGVINNEWFVARFQVDCKFIDWDTK